MKSLLTILFIFISLSFYGQKLEAFGGINLNVFHDYNKSDYKLTSFESGIGPTIGIGIDSVRLDKLKFRFTLQFDQYSGELYQTQGRISGHSTTEAEVSKSILSLGIFPVNFRIVRRIDINIGVLLSWLIAESFEGTLHGWSIPNNSFSYNLQDKYDQYGKPFTVGLVGRIGYDIKILNDFFISPQYAFFYGISNEFVETPQETKSMRHYFCLGVEKRLK